MDRTLQRVFSKDLHQQKQTRYDGNEMYKIVTYIRNASNPNQRLEIAMSVYSRRRNICSSAGPFPILHSSDFVAAKSTIPA